MDENEERRKAQYQRNFNNVLNTAKELGPMARFNYLNSCEKHGGDMELIVRSVREHFGTEYSI